MPHQDDPIVGRGLERGAALFRDWFASLDEVAAQGRTAAYVFVMGSVAELLRAFELPVVFPEINSLQTAVRRVAHEYLSDAEDYGYSPDICAYVKADVGVQLRNGAHPMGRVPKPGLAVLTNACNTYIKWAEIWERMYGTPVVTIDVPGTRRADRVTRPGDADFGRDRAYVVQQLRELVNVCEGVSGRRFDPDRLREHMRAANDLTAGFKHVLDLNRCRPAPFNAVTDGTVYLGVANGLRGMPAAGRYFAELEEEMAHKVLRGIGTTREERYRLAFVGVPCYPMFRRFNEMFSEWGGTFVCSTYLWFASGGAALGWQYELADPLDSLAEGLLVGVRHAMDNMFFADAALDRMVDGFDIDGVVFHSVKSCRTVSTGLADARRSFSERHDLPSLFLESDMMDRRVVSEAQIKNRVDAFFEGLATRRGAGSVTHA
jgi:benzoyl-CoA reductase subunit B